MVQQRARELPLPPALTTVQVGALPQRATGAWPPGRAWGVRDGAHEQAPLWLRTQHAPPLLPVHPDGTDVVARALFWFSVKTMPDRSVPMPVAVIVMVAAATLPADGNSWPTLVALAGWYFLLAAVFALLSRGQTASYNRGTVLADGGGGS